MAMDPAHSTELDDMIQEVVDTGAAKILERRLLRIYGAKNVSKSIWRDLQQRFADAVDERDDEWTGYWLACLRSHASLTFVAMEPLDNKPKDFWWQSVAQNAGVDWSNSVKA